MSHLLTGLGYDEPKYHVPYYVVYVIALLLALFVAVLRPFCVWTPSFTPMSVAMAGTHHYYSCQRAKADLEYKPEIPLHRAILETVESFSYLKKQ
jgi:sterol-4alpha-carboxylate 3-dehydrogenase (decarboxylating)